MHRAYPRFSVAERLKGQGPRCAVCGQLARYRCTIQINWFRGDDLVLLLCETHRDEARQDAALVIDKLGNP